MGTLEKKKQTNDKKSLAYSFFISKGYTPEQSAGIVGNLVKESSLNTKAEGDIGYAGGSSFGIAQWRGDRLTKLKNMYGNKWSDFNNQLEYVHWELNNTESKAGQALKNAKDVHSAGAVISDLYERPKVKYNQDKTRRQFVTDVYKSLVNSDYEYVAPQQSTFDPTKYESIIKPLNYLPETNVNTTFAGVPDGALLQEEKTEKEEQETDKDIEELQNKTVEQNFLEELYQSNSNRETTDQSQIQTQPQQKAPPVDYMQMYEQVSNFVDTPLIGGEEVMQQGGMKKPIYVDDKNDPRYRAYQDSLRTYNLAPEYNKEILENLDRAKTVRGGSLSNLETNEKFRKKGMNYSIGFNRKELPRKNVTDGYVGVIKYDYKKPQQPVIVQPLKETPQVQQINQLTPAEIQRQEQSLSSDLYLNPQVPTPKRVKVVDRINQNFGGSETSYEIPYNQLQDQPEMLSPNTRIITPLYQQGGEYSESELAFLSEIAIKDNQGQYNHPNKITEINSPNITMKGLTKPLLGISKETGETKYMLPNKDYKFGKNTKNVIEIPLFKK
jgi:hypothetical protein